MFKNEKFQYWLAEGTTTHECELEEIAWHRALIEIEFEHIIRPLYNKKPDNILNLQWENKRAIQHVDEMLKYLGFSTPDFIDPKEGGRVVWYDKNGLNEVMVVDKHYAKFFRDLPPPGLSFVRGICQVRLTADQAAELVKYSPNLSYIIQTGELFGYAKTFPELISNFAMVKLNSNGEANLSLAQRRATGAPARINLEYDLAVKEVYENNATKMHMPVYESAYKFVIGAYNKVKYPV